MPLHVTLYLYYSADFIGRAVSDKSKREIWCHFCCWKGRQPQSESGRMKGSTIREVRSAAMAAPERVRVALPRIAEHQKQKGEATNFPRRHALDTTKIGLQIQVNCSIRDLAAPSSSRVDLPPG